MTKKRTRKRRADAAGVAWPGSPSADFPGALSRPDGVRFLLRSPSLGEELLTPFDILHWMEKLTKPTRVIFLGMHSYVQLQHPAFVQRFLHEFAGDQSNAATCLKLVTHSVVADKFPAEMWNEPEEKVKSSNVGSFKTADRLRRRLKKKRNIKTTGFLANRQLRGTQITPYHRLPGGGSTDLDEISIYCPLDKEDLLCNLTCKSTKLARQKRVYLLDEILSEMDDLRPRFLYRPRRIYDPDYFGADFDLQPFQPPSYRRHPLSYAGNISPYSMDFYAKRVNLYDMSILRLQNGKVHDVPNTLHLIRWQSLAGERDYNGNFLDDEHSRFLLKCYANRVDKFLNNPAY